MCVIAYIRCDPKTGFFGHTRNLTDRLSGLTILEHTLRRVARVRGITAIVLGHTPEHAPDLTGIDLASLDIPLEVCPAAIADASTGWWTSGRKWCLNGWRGGLGSATVFDEALPPGPILEAMDRHQADSAMLLAADWCLMDLDIASALVERHLEAPADYPLVFTQASPGLTPVVAARTVFEQFVEHGAGFGSALGYQPRHAKADPIGKDVCLQVPVAVRDAYRRFIYDTPAARHDLQRIATGAAAFTTTDAKLNDLGAASIAEIAADFPLRTDGLARWATLHLTTERPVGGPITLQHHQSDDAELTHRPPMSRDEIERALAVLGEAGDVPVIFGGVGDALCHPDWRWAVERANELGVLGVAIETDLLVAPEVVDELVDAPIDVLRVRLNADSKATYHDLMGVDAFEQVMANIRQFRVARIERDRDETPGSRRIWLAPTFIKTRQNVGELESFYERWKRAGAHPVLDRVNPGVDERGDALMPDDSPVPMAPPKPVKWPTAVNGFLPGDRVTQDAADFLGVHAESLQAIEAVAAASAVGVAR